MVAASLAGRREAPSAARALNEVVAPLRWEEGKLRLKAPEEDNEKRVEVWIGLSVGYEVGCIRFGNIVYRSQVCRDYVRKKV